MLQFKVDSESDDDDAIRETDLVFAAASAEEDHCSLEIYVRRNSGFAAEK